MGRRAYSALEDRFWDIGWGLHYGCLDKEDGFRVVGSDGGCVGYPVRFEEIFNEIEVVGRVGVVGIEVVGFE